MIRQEYNLAMKHYDYALTLSKHYFGEESQ